VRICGRSAGLLYCQHLCLRFPQPGSATEELLIHIRELPSASEGGEHFNIVVTEETSQVYYTADGVPYAVWDQEGGQG
jgi:hypothetical protein